MANSIQKADLIISTLALAFVFCAALAAIIGALVALGILPNGFWGFHA